MAYKQMHDLLECAQRFHHSLAEFYTTLETKVDEARVKMLLGYMKRHELYLEECIAIYEADANLAVTDTWLKYEPSVELETFLENLKASSDMSIDEVVEIALDLDSYLIEFYKMIVESAPSEDIRAVFNSMLKIEEREKKIVSKTGLRMKYI
ncbi:MAG: hypothetical protein ACYTFY_22065 [Planctomycetota bacterium]|jgi:rubrerythrin